jgi:hypothetical protein
MPDATLSSASQPGAIACASRAMPRRKSTASCACAVVKRGRPAPSNGSPPRDQIWMQKS